MTKNILRSILPGLILGMVFALGLSLTSSASGACPQPDDPKAVEFCSSNFLLTDSGISAIGGHTGIDNTITVDYPRLPSDGMFNLFGQIYYIYLPLIRSK